MKKMNRLIALLLSVMTTSSLVFAAGCFSNPDGPTIDTTKTQLYISNYNGGYGDEWLQKLKTSFEKDYADYKLGDNVGVQVIINNNKSSHTELASVASSKNEIFYLSGSYYSEARDGKFLDITDIVTEGGENSLESRLTENQKTYFKSYNGKYYALPRQEGVYGLIYNVDMFNDNSLFFKKNDCPSEKNYSGTVGFTNEAGDRSMGPDGQYGTYDDGLPATYEDMFILFDRMYTRGVVPVTWTGWYYTTYLAWLLEAFAVDYEGVSNLSTYYNLNGKLSSYVQNITENANALFDDVVLSETTIANPSEGNKLFKTAGRYYALKVLEKILSEDKYYDSDVAFKATVSHTDAQYNFLNDNSGKSIAMLVEGSWWETEASSSFKLLGKNKSDCRYAFLPTPKVSTDYLGKTTYTEQQNTFAFINAYIDESKIDLAKAFLKYSYSLDALREYTVTTGTPIAMKYDLTDEQYNSLSYFGKSVWKIHDGTNGTVVYQASGSPTFYGNHQTLQYSATFAAGKSVTPFDSFRKKDTTALKYFNGVSDYFSKEWSSLVIA